MLGTENWRYNPIVPVEAHNAIHRNIDLASSHARDLFKATTPDRIENIFILHLLTRIKLALRMQMAGGDARTDQIHVLELKKAHVRDLASIIKAISFRENATFQATPQGMRILVDDHLCQQECIGMHTGSGATLKMTYDGAGEPVKLILEEDGIVVDMRVQTLTTEEILDFEFDAEDVTFQVIMKSYMLKEAIKELDASSATVTLSVNNDELSLTTTGEIGKSVTRFPRHSEQIERLECAEPVVHQYPLNLIRKMNPAFAIASKCVPFVDD
ncbi:repair protein Rad1/Rec1/Rad17 [Teladorsagia circumcincta]|uniref:Repair protein Rad1/Rec1/Rad17 n=1 Tax=Teladorsagia circumcincta TaxID=45464 RepID=A0A2G9UNG4_TELCI|nr:repair protein Rad1/Rec1/Rad17 [Teladorsagia circumcincta]